MWNRVWDADWREGGKGVVDVKGDEYAHNRGRLSIKGLMNREILYEKVRALHPMIRKNGKLERATREEAMETWWQRNFVRPSTSSGRIVWPITGAANSILRKVILPKNYSRRGLAL